MGEVSGAVTGWAEVRSITSDQYPLPARRPLNLVTNKDKARRIFGVEMPKWEAQLQSFLRELAVRDP
jgi:dTDP-4-dehydrorhamnose reductase